MIDRRPQTISVQNLIFGTLFLVAAVVLLLWLAKSVFAILAWLAPILLIATLIIDYKVLLRYGKWILNALKANLMSGILYSVLTVVFFPVVSFLLFGRALLSRKVKNLEKAYREVREPAYTEYEIVDESGEDQLELPEILKQQKTSNEDYEQLFD